MDGWMDGQKKMKKMDGWMDKKMKKKWMVGWIKNKKYMDGGWIKI